MALTPSSMAPLGGTAPFFDLPNTIDDRRVSLENFKGKKGLLVMFLCNHCPYVKHVNAQLVSLARDYLAKDIGIVAISSNDIEAYPLDAPLEMKKVALEEGYPFAYLYDADQSVARSYQAECTPDFFLYDQNFKLVYRGQLDDSRPNSKKPVTGRDLRMAMDLLLEGRKIPEETQIPSSGCNIKWKK